MIIAKNMSINFDDNAIDIKIVAPRELFEISYSNDTQWGCIDKLKKGILKLGYTITNMKKLEWHFTNQIDYIIENIVLEYLLYGNVWFYVDKFVHHIQGNDIIGEDSEYVYTTNKKYDKKDVIAIRSNLKYNGYGLPNWLPIIKIVETMVFMDMYNKAFFQNNGKPDGILSIVGSGIDDDTENNIRAFFQNYSGVANSHKILIIASEETETKIKYDKLTDHQVATFTEEYEALRNRVLAIHSVPPRLLGIITPGKLGDNKELLEQLFMFEEFTLKPWRRELEKKINEFFKYFGQYEITINDDQNIYDKIGNGALIV